MRLLHAARLSRLRDESTGIEKQDEQAAKYAAAFGHEIVATAADTDVSGSTDPMKRPKLGPYLTDAHLKGGYDGIIASALDRFGRNARQMMELRDWAEANGKVLIVISPSLQWPPKDEDDFASPIIWDLLGRLAEYELKAITKRNRETGKWLRENGYLQGRPPFGYKVSGKDNHKTLAPDPDLAPVIREMAQRYLDGATLLEIATWLESQGVRPPSSELWGHSSIRLVLTNTALIGRRKDAAGRTILRFEPILDEVTFRRVQAAWEGRSFKKGGAAEESLLSGVIYCAKCGRKMSHNKTGDKLKNGQKVYRYYYRCYGTIREPSTCKNMIPRDKADEAMSSWVTDVIGPVQLIERTVIPAHGHDEDIADTEAEIRALDLDDPDYDEKSAALRAERKRLKELPASPAEVSEQLSDYTAKDLWETLDKTEDRRDWLIAGKVKLIATKESFSVELEMGGDWAIPAAKLGEAMGQGA
jgi:site-specific DNA recombinase